ncbi:MAG: DUF669 domain-containing protein [Candidatus Paceibacterota bacterium]
MPLLQFVKGVKDLSKLPKQEPLDAGTYDVIITSIEAKSNDAGKNYLEIKLKVVSADKKANSRMLFYYQSLPAEEDEDEKAEAKQRYFLKFLENIGADPKPPYNTDKWLNRKCRAVVEQEEYQGEPVAKVKKVISAAK